MTTAEREADLVVHVPRKAWFCDRCNQGYENATFLKVLASGICSGFWIDLPVFTMVYHVLLVYLYILCTHIRTIAADCHC